MSEKRGCLARLGDLLSLVLTLYALVTLVLLVVGWLLAASVAVAGILKGVAAILLLPVLVLFVLSLLIRRRRPALLLLPLVVVFFVLYVPYFLPRAATPAVEAGFTAMTFNLEAPDADEVAPLADVIRAADADIVTLQELSQAAADELDTALSDVYPYRVFYPQANPHDGQGLLSRFAIEDSHFFEFEGQRRTLGHMRAELMLDDGPIVVYDVHPVPPISFSLGLMAEAHSHAVDLLLERAAEETLPLLMLGDFNMSDQFPEYDRLTRRYIDSFRVAGEPGFGFTYPTDTLPLPPVLRLDYIFHDAAFVAEHVRVWPDTGTSDHHPLWARLTRVASAPSAES